MPLDASAVVDEFAARVRAAVVPTNMDEARWDKIWRKLRPTFVGQWRERLARLPWGGWIPREERDQWINQEVLHVDDQGRQRLGRIVEIEKGGFRVHVTFVESGSQEVVRGRELQLVDARPTGRTPPPTTRKARMAANLAALKILSEREPPYAPADVEVIRQFSGFGGLSVKELLPQWPPNIPPPSPRALLDEYYTPPVVADAMKALARERLNTVLDENGHVLALEPSAGIGRLLMQDQRLTWVAVEISKVSSRLLRGVFPGVQTYNQPFELFFAEHGPEYYQRVGLVLSNPPYNDERGPSKFDDPDRSTRRLYPAQYFMQRSTELMKPGGIGIYLVPHSVLTGPKSEEWRREYLRRAHLVAAFRLPSDLFPGALVVVDVWLVRARGGLLPQVSSEDEFIVAGQYFQKFPGHVLGVEETGEGVRRKYQVRGEFHGLPSFVDRPMCDCPVQAFPSFWMKNILARVLDEEEISPEILKARALGALVGEFARREASDEAVAPGAWQAVSTALKEWSLGFGNPHEHPDLLKLQDRDKDIGRFLALFSPQGLLVEDWLRPRVAAKKPYQDIVAIAEDQWLNARAVPLALALQLHEAAGLGPLDREAAMAVLEPAGWALEGRPGEERLVPMRHYLTGELWSRVDDAKAFGTPWATRQIAALRRKIDPLPFAALTNVSPRFAWVGTPILSAWLSAELGAPIEIEVDEDGMLREKGEVRTRTRTATEETETETTAGKRNDPKRLLLGYLNDDRGEFSPNPDKFVVKYREFLKALLVRQLGEGAARYGEYPWIAWDNEEDSAKLPSLTEAVRQAMEADFDARFRVWLDANPEIADLYAENYNRRFRGWSLPEYPRELPLPLGWAAAVKPHWWQFEGAARLLDQRGGLCAYDVGLGKTLTAILTIALGKERGTMRRVVIVTPNSVVWQWFAEITRAMPAWNIGVIGSKLVRTRDDKVADRNDTPGERAQKWLNLQRGLYDVVLVTGTAFPRVNVDTEALEPFYREMRDFLRLAYEEKEKLKAIKKKLQAGQEVPEGEEPTDEDEEAEDATEDAAEDEEGKKKKPKRTWTERDEARLVQNLASFLRELNELPPKWRPDPGVVWNDLGIDALFVDEAQRYKELFLPPPIDGAIPKFMGSGQQSSKRAWQLHARAAAVRQRQGGTGVYLLSATPAKNSPLELYNLISYVSSEVWQERGIATHFAFVRRFCTFANAPTLNSRLQPDSKMALVGFQNLDELRSILFRLAAFYNAEQVKLPLPKPEVVPLQVEMSLRQQEMYEAETEKMADAVKRRSQSGIFSALANMSLIAIHPALVDRDKLPDGSLEPHWNWGNAHEMKAIHSAKFDRCAEQILAQADCQHLVFLQPIAGQVWLREVLIRKGIPAEKIAIMNAKTTPRPGQRRAMGLAFTGSDPVLPGEQEIPPTIRVLIANEVAYEGVNLQRRTCAIHHVDIPWEPATLQQRNGRGVRQGNKEDVVAIYYYLAKASSDGLRFEQIRGKLGWMEVLIAGTDRETNNPAAQQAVSGSQMTLALARNPEAMAELIKTLRTQEAKENAEKFIRGLGRELQQIQGRLEEARRAEPVEAARLREQAAAAWGDLVTASPPGLRRRLAAAGRVLYSRPITVTGAVLTWPGLVLQLGELVVEVGHATSTDLWIRTQGEAEWRTYPRSELARWRVEEETEKIETTEGTVDVPRIVSPVSEADYDRRLDEPDLAAALLAFATEVLGVTGDWTALGWEGASDEFRTRAWGFLHEWLVTRVRNFSGPALPAIRDGEVVLAQGAELAEVAVLPWTLQGWERAMRAPLAKTVKIPAMLDTSQKYWNRPFRRTREAIPSTTTTHHPVLLTAARTLMEQGFGTEIGEGAVEVYFEGVHVGRIEFRDRLLLLPAAPPTGAEKFHGEQLQRVKGELERCCDLFDLEF